jgi:hypothetical protein
LNVWQDETGKIWVLDGCHRQAALKECEEEGLKLDDLKMEIDLPEIDFDDFEKDFYFDEIEEEIDCQTTQTILHQLHLLLHLHVQA